MCTFITVFLPTSLPHGAAAAVFTRSGRRLFAQDSPSLQAAVGPDWQPWLSAVHCDCGTALASARAAPEWTGDAERWRKKGWSEAKIGRALAEQLARHVQDQQARRDEALGDAGQWPQRICWRSRRARCIGSSAGSAGRWPASHAEFIHAWRGSTR